MTASHKESENVLRAYVFVVRFDDGKPGESGCIARTHKEAEEIMEKLYSKFPYKVSLFGVAQTVMQPAMIEWWSRDAGWRDVRHEEKGFYAFLNGIFFCQCNNHKVAEHCKQEKTRTGWTAVIYGDNHDIKPL